jgi:chromosomal replication initiation ATPase DnaA
MASRPTSFIRKHPGTSKAKDAKDVVVFLRAHDKLATLLPAAARLVALQKDCAAILPSQFAWCSPLAFENGQLTLAIPNAALAAKLKQQLPKLQDNLLKRGWQVIAIRLKVQVVTEIAKKEMQPHPGLSIEAVAAFAQLESALEKTPQNSALKDALKKLVEKRTQTRTQDPGGASSG